MSSVAGSLKVGFINIEGLKRKINNKDFLDLLKANVFGLAESWARFETYNMEGYTRYIKGRNKTAKFGRKPGGSVVYVKNSISKKVIEIPTEMKEVIWIEVKDKTSPCIKVCISFIYKAPQNLRWYNPNFTKELEGDINNLMDSYPNSSHKWYGSRKSKDTTCNAKGRKLIDFCEKNGLEVPNGIYGSDTGGEFTFFVQFGSSVIDYALMSDGVICNAIDLKVGIEIISSHMPLLVELGNIMEWGVNTKSYARSQTQTHKTRRYIWK
jgi:hypothetical protein